MQLIEELVSILWTGIAYCEYWAEQIFTAFGMDLRLFVVSLVFLSAGYRFIIGPYLQGTSFSFLDYTKTNTYNPPKKAYPMLNSGNRSIVYYDKTKRKTGVYKW